MSDLTAEEERDLIERTASFLKKLALGEGLTVQNVMRVGTGDQAGLFEDETPETIVDVITGVSFEALDTPAIRAIRNALGVASSEQETTLTERRDRYKQAANISLSTVIRHEQQGAEDLAGYMVRRMINNQNSEETPLAKLEQRVSELEMMLSILLLPPGQLPEDFRRDVMSASMGIMGQYVVRVSAALDSYKQRFPEEFKSSSESQPDQD
ncbi:hypothetical protein [Arthrobacter sp. EpRS71]|uniref:hypothetical protein n=1 Tax=Arthrobacter sp. EpRS71 TaxID=1743141 RepID=UPI0007473DD4|nr:hypothetical protein [Arthrobacter sp. EpRS71]KUM39033.1 hypothetical protein AR689_07715 [Arthrobacter sp. EpRS71]